MTYKNPSNSYDKKSYKNSSKIFEKNYDYSLDCPLKTKTKTRDYCSNGP